MCFSYTLYCIEALSKVLSFNLVKLKSLGKSDKKKKKKSFEIIFFFIVKMSYL
jgi:hypothetical protein